MPSVYLQAADYCLFGLPETTEPQEVIRASALVNAYCLRPEGFISSDGLVMDTTGEAIVVEQNVPVSRRVVLSRLPVVSLIRLEASPSGQPFRWAEYAVGEYGHLNKRTGVLDLPPQVPCPGRARVSYVAGWTYAALPDGIKLAVSTLVKRISQKDDLGPDVKRAKAGDAMLEWFSPEFFDAEVQALLSPYRVVVPG